MARSRDGRRRVTVVSLLLVSALVLTTGVATAAVSGSFTSSYDGYNDGEQTDVRGHEIQTSGTLDFSGENAVNVRITVRDTQHTVLDETSVELLQPGGTSISFEKRYTENGVRYVASEIPSGTTLELNFVAYPVTGLEKSEIKSAEVVVSSEGPNGERSRKTIDVTTSLGNTPPKVINAASRQEQLGLAMQVLAGIGALSVVIAVLSVLWWLYDGGGNGVDV